MLLQCPSKSFSFRISASLCLIFCFFSEFSFSYSESIFCDSVLSSCSYLFFLGWVFSGMFESNFKIVFKEFSILKKKRQKKNSFKKTSSTSVSPIKSAAHSAQFLYPTFFPLSPIQNIARVTP